MKTFDDIYNENKKSEPLMLESPNVVKFCKELDLIKNTNKKEALKKLLRPSAYKNIKGEASSTGKYHPSFAKGDFGLSRHTKAVVKNVLVICDAFPDELDQDTLIAAAIAHDAYKYDSDESNFTAKNHAANVANKLEQLGLKDEARLCRCHMGRWDSKRDKSGKTPAPKEFDEQMLHLADFFASRTYLSIDFDKDDNIIEENDNPERLSNKYSNLQNRYEVLNYDNDYKLGKNSGF